MKTDIHPQYHRVEATCVCGNVVLTGSVLPALKMDVCSACHPFFTGVQKLLDAEGRVEQFNKRFAGAVSSKKTKKKSEPEAPKAEAAPKVEPKPEPQPEPQPEPEAVAEEAPVVEETAPDTPAATDESTEA